MWSIRPSPEETPKKDGAQIAGWGFKDVPTHAGKNVIGWSSPSFAMSAAEGFCSPCALMLALRAGAGALDSAWVWLCVRSTEHREGLTHATSWGISCLPGWRLCHRPLEVRM